MTPLRTRSVRRFRYVTPPVSKRGKFRVRRDDAENGDGFRAHPLSEAEGVQVAEGFAVQKSPAHPGGKIRSAFEQLDVEAPAQWPGA